VISSSLRARLVRRLVLAVTGLEAAVVSERVSDPVPDTLNGRPAGVVAPLNGTTGMGESGSDRVMRPDARHPRVRPSQGHAPRW
jgi:hypothetical protein